VLRADLRDRSYADTSSGVDLRVGETLVKKREDLMNFGSWEWSHGGVEGVVGLLRSVESV
jgi:hypothetical protein